MSKWVRTDSLDYKALRFLSGADLRAALDAAPGLEIVFCGDCRFWQDNNGGYPHEECRWGHDETPEWDDYCSFGIAMEGEDDADK